MCRERVGSFLIVCPEPVKPTFQMSVKQLFPERDFLAIPLALMPSGVRNMLSFFATFPSLPLLANSCHLLLPASSSLFALTFRGTFAGLIGPSLTLLGSLLAWLAKAGSTFAAADMTLGFVGGAGVADSPGVPSALRLRESVGKGLMSLAESVSVEA